MTRRPQSALLLVAAATALAGCGSSQPPTSATSPGSPVQVPGTTGYLNSSSTQVTYLQWQQDPGGAFQGTDLSATATGTPPNETVNTTSSPIDGQITGSAVTLDVDFHTDQGVLAGNNLTLNVLQPNGTIESVAYHQASAADYDTALTQLQHAVSQADAQAAVQNALNTLQADNSAFTNANSVRDDLTTTTNDLQKERSDAANGNGENCYNIQSVVDYDAQSTVGYDVTSKAGSDVSHEQSGITQYRTDIQTLQNANTALQTTGMPALPAVASAITTAQQQLAEAIATTNQAIDTLNNDLATAYSIANAAGTGPCTGDGPGTPPPGLSHIS
jgi:hypothetical protein